MGTLIEMSDYLLNEEELTHLAALAALDFEKSKLASLTQEVTALITLANQLHAIDTTTISPLFHPLDLNQPLRKDEVQMVSCVTELRQMTPTFEHDLYWVPKVIDTGL